MRTQQASINRTTSRRDNIANKLMMPPRSITARYNRSLRYARVQKQRCLNLPRLNPKTADLNLMVRSTHKLQNPVRPPPRQIPAAVHPGPRSTKPVGNKALPRQPSTTQIPARYSAPRYVKLPNNPNSNRLQTIVQYVNPQIGNAAPDKIAAARSGKLSVQYNVTDMHRRFGDPVHVDQHGGIVETLLVPIFKFSDIQRFTAKDHMTQAKRSASLGMLPLRLR